ncbi:heme-binding domain-containing protein [candidate division KSB1 bacterium]|nr:heme-binding domain-containing protein [candidate division KSB1 bacterium]
MKAKMNFKIWLILIVIILVLIQLIPVNKTNPPVTAEIITNLEIKSILVKSCYDCHSNQTSWPWYSSIAPVSWFISHHVQEGREYVNFSEWENLSQNQKAHTKQEILKEINNNKMPLKSYLLIHKNSVLTNDEKQLITLWVSQKDSSENIEKIIF